MHRPRPDFFGIVKSQYDFGYPSGHVMEAVVGAFVIVTSFWPSQTLRQRALSVSAAVLLVLALSFSRVYEGAHFFSDTLAGGGAGLVWASAGWLILRRLFPQLRNARVRGTATWARVKAAASRG